MDERLIGIDNWLKLRSNSWLFTLKEEENFDK